MTAFTRSLQANASDASVMLARGVARTLAEQFPEAIADLQQAKAHAYYRQSAALGNHKAREALATFNRFVLPDKQSAAIYDERVTRWMSAINGCQAQADRTGQAVRCLVPVIDWNPKTCQDC